MLNPQKLVIMKSLNQITRILIWSLLSLTFMFSACKKDNEMSVKTELLTSGLWKISALTIDPAFPIYDNEFNIIGTTNDYFAMMDNCEKDDTRTFKTDKTMIIDDGLTKCDSSDPQKVTGTWNFNSDETVLTSTANGETLNFIIMELTDKVLKLKYTETVDSETATVNITFSH